MALFKPSILRTLLFAYLLYGVLIGSLFPWAAGMYFNWSTPVYIGVITACVSVGVVSAIIYYVMLRLLLLRRLEQISMVANAISNNDISHQCTLQSDDLIGDIINSFNQMAHNLRDTISLIDHTSAQLSQTSTQISEVSHVSGQSIARQQTQTGEVAGAMTQMVAMVQEVAHHSEQASTAANSATEEARSGALLATEAIGSIDCLSGAIKHAVEVIDKVKEENGNIGSLLDVIRGITEQTNLLALNAAIEAARAGEQGRGFAVVADEVRTLAKRTQDSTLQIQDMIERLNQQVGAAVAVMGEASTQALDSEDKVEKAAISLSEIAGSVKAISQMNASVADASSQQTAVVEEINNNIAGIAQAGEASTQAMQSSTTAVSDLHALSQRLRELVGKFTL